jgi:hypothetical protein
MAKSHGQQTISLDFWLLRLHEGCHLCVPYVIEHLNTGDSGYISHTATGHNIITVKTSAALQKEHEENIRRFKFFGIWHCVDQKQVTEIP